MSENTAVTEPVGDPAPVADPPNEPVETPAPAVEADEPKTYDQAYVEKLRKEAATYRTKLREVEPLVEEHNKRVEAEKTEVERERGEKEAALSANASLIVELVAAKHGIPADNIDLLGSGTREELEERAQRLAALATPAPPTEPKAPPSERPVESLRPGASPKPEEAPDNSYPASWRPAARERI